MTKQETIDAFFARFKRIVDKAYSVHLQKNGYITMEKHQGDPDRMIELIQKIAGETVKIRIIENKSIARSQHWYFNHIKFELVGWEAYRYRILNKGKEQR